MQTRGRSVHVTLKPTPILRPLLILLAFVVTLAAGYLWGEWAGGRDYSGDLARVEATNTRLNEELMDYTHPDRGRVPPHGAPHSDKR